MSCFKGRMREYTSVSLDRFDGRNLSSTVFCLSHCHQDHMAGLDAPVFHNRLKSRTDLFLYCTDLTKTLLLADNRYTHLEKFIKTLEVNVPTMMTIPDQEGDNKKSGTVLVTGLSAGHCPGSLMFLFEGKEGTVLYTGDFRWETNYAQNLQAFRTGDSVKNIKSLYIDTTFCFENAFHFPSRNECVDAASELVSKWLNHSKNHVVSLSCKAKYGYEHFLQELSSRTGEKIHTSQDKCNIYQKIGELKDVFTSDPSARIHVCNFKADRSPLSKLPCGYVPTDDTEQQVLALRPSTMFFALQRPLSRPTDLIVYPKGSRGLHRVCYSFHSSYVEVRDLVMYLKPDRVFPNVKPPEESDMTKVQARLNGFLKMVHLSEVPSLQAPSRLLGQLKIRRGVCPDSSQSESEDLNFGTPEKKKPVAQRPQSTPTKRELTPSEASNADSSYQGSVGKEEEELDLFGSQDSVSREEKMEEPLAAGDSAESYCLYISGDEDCPEEDRLGSQSYPDLDDVIVIESQDSPSDMPAAAEPSSDKREEDMPISGKAATKEPQLDKDLKETPLLDKTEDQPPKGTESELPLGTAADQLDKGSERPDSSNKKSVNDDVCHDDDLLLDSEDDLLEGKEETVNSPGRNKEISLKDGDQSGSKEDDILMDSDNDLLDEVPKGFFKKKLAEKSVKEICKDDEILVDSDDDLLDSEDEEDDLGKVTVELIDDEEEAQSKSRDGVKRIEENSIKGKGSQDDIRITGESSSKVIYSGIGESNVKTKTVSKEKLDKVNVVTSRSGASPKDVSDRVKIRDHQNHPESKVSESVESASCEKSGLGDKSNSAMSSISETQSVVETASCSNSINLEDKNNCSESSQNLSDGAKSSKDSVSKSLKGQTRLKKTSSFDLFDEGHVTDIEDNAVEDIPETQGFDVEVLETEMRSRRRKYITEIDQDEEITLRRATAQMLLRLQAGSHSSSGVPRTLSRPVDSEEQIVISSSDSDTESGFLSGGKEVKPAQGLVTGKDYAKNLGALVSKMEKRLASSDGEYSPSKRIRLDISRNCESDSDVTLPPSQGSYGSRLQPCLFFDSDSVSESESEMDTDSDALEILYETDASGAKYDVQGNLMRPETTIVRMQTQTVGQTLKAGESQFIDLTEDNEEEEEETEAGRDEKDKGGGSVSEDKSLDKCNNDSADESNLSKKEGAKDKFKGSKGIEVVENQDQKEKVKDIGEGSGVIGQGPKVMDSSEGLEAIDQREKVKDMDKSSGDSSQCTEGEVESNHKVVVECEKNSGGNTETSDTIESDLKNTEDD